MKIVFHSLAFLLIGTFLVGAVPQFFHGSPGNGQPSYHQLSPNFYNQPGLFRQANIPGPGANKFDHPPQAGPIPQDEIGIAVQPGMFIQSRPGEVQIKGSPGPFGQLSIPGQPRFPNQFDHPQKPGPFDPYQIGTNVQPGTYGQPGPGQPMQSGPLAIPGQPRFANNFDHPQPGPIPQDQIGIAVQPGVFIQGQGQGQGQGPAEPFGQLTIPGQPRFPNQFDHPQPTGPFDPYQVGVNVQPESFGQPGPEQPIQSAPLSIPGQPRFSNQNGPIISPQPGSNDQLGPYAMGVPGSNVFEPQKTSIEAVNWQYQQFKHLNDEIAKQIREMIQNKSIAGPRIMPQNFQAPFSVPNAWAPFPQNRWAQRIHRSPLPNLQALQAQGYQIIRLKDYQNLEKLSASGPGGAFSKLNIRSDEETSDKKFFGSSLAQNSTLNATENFSNKDVPNMRAASSSEHMIVGNPLKICKDYETIDQHHPTEENKKLKSFCTNFFKNVMPSFPSYSSEAPSTSHSEDYLVTDNISKTSGGSIRNLSQAGQQLPNNQPQKTQSDGQNKRFRDNFIGLSEELVKNSTNGTAAPVQYRYYRPSVNGNLPQQIPFPAIARANPQPNSTPKMNNYNSFHPLAAGSAFYKPTLWPGNAPNNNNQNFRNFAPVYSFTPANNYYLQKFPVYQTPNYFSYQ